MAIKLLFNKFIRSCIYKLLQPYWVLPQVATKQLWSDESTLACQRNNWWRSEKMTILLTNRSILKLWTILLRWGCSRLKCIKGFLMMYPLWPAVSSESFPILRKTNEFKRNTPKRHWPRNCLFYSLLFLQIRVNQLQKLLNHWPSLKCYKLLPWSNC